MAGSLVKLIQQDSGSAEALAGSLIDQARGLSEEESEAVSSAF